MTPPPRATLCVFDALLRQDRIEETSCPRWQALASLHTTTSPRNVKTDCGRLFRKVQIVVEPLPRVDLVDVQSRLSVCQRREEEVAPADDGENDARGDPAA